MSIGYTWKYSRASCPMGFECSRKNNRKRNWNKFRKKRSSSRNIYFYLWFKCSIWKTYISSRIWRQVLSVIHLILLDFTRLYISFDWVTNSTCIGVNSNSFKAAGKAGKTFLIILLILILISISYFKRNEIFNFFENSIYRIRELYSTYQTNRQVC